MPIRIKRFLHRRAVVVSILFLTVASVAGLVVRARAAFMARSGRSVSAVTKDAAQTPSAQIPTTPHSTAPSEHIEAELITVRRTGFDPVHIKRPDGPFFLVIENRSGRDLGTLSLEPAVTGLAAPVSHVAEARIKKESVSYGERLDLPPGRYRLTETGDSGWSITITIEPR
jgi:hypothetical protein